MTLPRAHDFAALAALAAAVLCAHGARAESIAIPGYGNLTPFATANVAGKVEDGKLGATASAGDDQDLQSVKSLVGIDWQWDVGYSYKVLGHYEYGGQVSDIEDTVDDARPFKSWLGFQNFLGTFTFGKQPLAFEQYYGTMIDRSQAFYATGYTTPHAGGLELSSDLVKFSTSLGRLEFDLDYRPDGPNGDEKIENRIGAGVRYRQWLSRITFGAAFDHEELRIGNAVDRFGAAAEYGSEQWSLAAGAHLVSDSSDADTKSFNLLATFQVRPDNELHLSLATVLDQDVYDGFVGGGYYVDHKIGSQFRLYSEGAATWVDAVHGSDSLMSYRLLFGVRYDFGNVWY